MVFPPISNKEIDMSLLRKTVASLAGGAMMMAAASANAYFLNIGGSIGNVEFNTIDWNENGSAYVSGFQAVAGDTFQLNAISRAVSLSNNSSTALLFSDSGAALPDFSAFGNYELTLVATLNEQVSSVVGNVANFNLLSGRFDIYLGAANGSLITGQNFSDGTRILGGVFNPGQAGSFTDLTLIPPGTPRANGSGSNNLVATVDYVNALLTPAPTDSNATTTLQYGLSAGGWVRPTSIDGVALPLTDSSSDFVLKADANQTLLTKTVPEPSSLALLGLAVGVFGVVRKRTEKKA